MATKDERLAYGFSTQFLNKYKGIRNLVDRAIDDGWTTTRFVDELRKTSWWKSRSDAQKRFAAMSVENPGEIRRQLSEASTQVKNLATRLGVSLSSGAVSNIAESWVKNDLDEAQVRDMVGRRYITRRRGNARQRGVIGVGGAAYAQINEMSRQYGLRWGDRFLTGAARNVARGVRQVSDYESYAREQASRLYKAVAADIKEGRTVREILDPYMQIASEELGLPVSTLDANASKWTAPISGDKQMTTDEWLAKIRSESRYGYDASNSASRQASIFSGQIMNMMGAR